MKIIIGVLITILIVAGLVWADVDTKDGIAITSFTNIDGFLLVTDDLDGQATKAGGLFDICAETGDESQWDSTTTAGTNTFEAQGTTKYAGLYAFEAAMDGSNEEAYGIYTFSDQTDLYVRFYFRFDSSFDFPATFDSAIIFRFWDGATELARVSFEEDNAGEYGIKIANMKPSFEEYYNTANGELSANTWYRFEMRYVIHASTGGSQFWLNGDSKGSEFSGDNSAYLIDKIHVGPQFGPEVLSGGSCFIDNIRGANSAIGP